MDLLKTAGFVTTAKLDVAGWIEKMDGPPWVLLMTGKEAGEYFRFVEGLFKTL